MKILVTSGGTKIPIDTVRSITNMSNGTFGSKIATELLKRGHEVLFLKAKHSRNPFEFNYNLFDNFESVQEAFKKKVEFVKRHRSRYFELEYATFDEYKETLERVVKERKPELILLAAAVSDYGVENPVSGKVRSNELLTIKLVQLPKLISKIKEWHPQCKLVGFKLLVGSKDTELVEAAKKSIFDNKCDMIVANDLQDIKNDKHKVHLVYETGEPIVYVTDPKDPNFLAKMVATHAERLYWH